MCGRKLYYATEPDDTEWELVEMSHLEIADCSGCGKNLPIIMRVTVEIATKEPTVAKLCAACSLKSLPTDKQSWISLVQESTPIRSTTVDRVSQSLSDGQLET
jgi:hypothetical protein